MSEQTPNSRDTHINPTAEQVPHSGVHGYELPPHPFDMDLSDALEADAVHHVKLDAAGNPVFDLPDTLADFSEPTKSLQTEAYEPLIAPPVKEKNRKKRLAAAVAGIVGTALLGGGYAAYRTAQDDTPQREKTSVSSNPNAATDAEAQTGNEPSSAEFGLNAETYVDKPEQLMMDFMDTYNVWQNTGVSVEASNADKRFEMSDEEYAAYLNQASDEAFISAMLVPDWENNPHLVEWVTGATLNHRTNSWGALMTTDTGGTEQSEPYRRFVDLDLGSVVAQSVTGNQIIVSGTWTGRDNSDLNRIEEIRTGGIDPNTEYGDYTLTFVKGADGSMLLADVDSYID